MFKDYYLQIYLLILSGIFIVISFLLYLSGGKNQKLLTHKLKIGALIISMTALVGCSHFGKEKDPPPTCYITLVNYIEISPEHFSQATIIVNIKEDNIVEAKIVSPINKYYSYRIINEENKLVQSGDLYANDGEYDDNFEEIKFEIDKDLPNGNYKIYFYPVALNEINDPEHSYCTLHKMTVK